MSNQENKSKEIKRIPTEKPGRSFAGINIGNREVIKHSFIPAKQETPPPPPPKKRK